MPVKYLNTKRGCLSVPEEGSHIYDYLPVKKYDVMREEECQSENCMKMTSKWWCRECWGIFSPQFLEDFIRIFKMIMTYNHLVEGGWHRSKVIVAAFEFSKLNIPNLYMPQFHSSVRFRNTIHKKYTEFSRENNLGVDFMVRYRFIDDYAA